MWVKDESIYTSAGIFAAIDLPLAWVEEDCGNAIATEVVREQLSLDLLADPSL